MIYMVFDEFSNVIPPRGKSILSGLDVTDSLETVVHDSSIIHVLGGAEAVQLGWAQTIHPLQTIHNL